LFPLGAVQKELTHEVLLHPKYFGPELHKQLVAKLYQEKEGQFDGRFGHIISVTEIVRITPGKVLVVCMLGCVLSCVRACVRGAD